MTGAQLREATGLPRRTIYAALKQLRELGILRERISLRDSRQTYFWLAGEEPQKLKQDGIASLFGNGLAPFGQAPRPAPF
jgi:DNA-binding transcriptional ArsR family regulator